MASLLLAAAACNGASPAVDAGPADTRPTDGVTPPDLSPGDGGTGNVGHKCDPQKGTGCTGAATCLKVAPGVGVCAIPKCTLEDIATPAVEDSCPKVDTPGGGAKTQTVCTRVPAAGGTFCLPKCQISTKKPRTNPCAKFHKSLTCDPVSLLYNDHSEVCLFAACQKDADCAGYHPLNPDYRCDKEVGICFPLGKKGVKVGAPCKKSTDCGSGQFCYPETKTSYGTVVEGGYCTVVGCSFGDPWVCPSGSKCFTMGTIHTLSLCLALGCQADKPPASDGCRDKASAGQYDCFYLDQHQVCWVAPKSR